MKVSSIFLGILLFCGFAMVSKAAPGSSPGWILPSAQPSLPIATFPPLTSSSASPSTSYKTTNEEVSTASTGVSETKSTSSVAPVWTPVPSGGKKTQYSLLLIGFFVIELFFIM